MEPPEVVVASAGVSRIVVRPLVRHESSTTWDQNWIECAVTVAAGAFRGEYTASLRAEEFTGFRRDLERLHRELRGVGRFDSMEGWIALEVNGDGRGHFSGTCHLRDR